LNAQNKQTKTWFTVQTQSQIHNCCNRALSSRRHMNAKQEKRCYTNIYFPNNF